MAGTMTNAGDSILGRLLLDAVIGDDVERVKQLIDAGASPNYAEDNDHVRPLHFAALYNSVSVVPALVLAGGDLRAVTEFEETPLAVARRHRHPEMVQHLYRYVSEVATWQ